MDGHDKDANNTQSNSANSNAQGIFSTPELTVDTENIAPTNTEETKSRVASIFANTDAGRSAEQLNNAMSVNSQPVTEDVVINNGPRKRSKVPIIVAIVVLVLAAIGLTAYLIISSSAKDNSQSVNTTTNAKAQASFARYANYLLYGEEKDYLDDNFQLSRVYKIDEVLREPSEYSEYWNTLLDLLEKAVSDYRNVDSKDNSLLDFMVEYQQNVKLLNFVHKIADPSINDSLKKYISVGKDQGINDTLHIYAQLSESNFTPAQEYYDVVKNLYTTQFDLLAIYANYGCIIDDIINDVCADNLSTETQAQITELANKESNYQKELVEKYNSLILYIKNDCWRINQRFIALNSMENNKQ